MFYLEIGINHFGKVKEAGLFLDFIFKSKFKNITFMSQSKNFYREQRKKKIDFELDQHFYKEIIKKCHKKNKKIGLSVCDVSTFKNLENLNFDFYKLLSVSINNYELINMLKKKTKPVFISTGFKATDTKINNCLKAFKPKKEISLLHTPMTYNFSELNLSRISHLKKKFDLNVGFSNHFKGKEFFPVLSAYNPSQIFLYCKQKRVKNRIYPDDGHAFYLDELESIKNEYYKYLSMNVAKKTVKKVNIFVNEFKL